MEFGEKIKKLRIEKGWNQNYVASALNISVPALSRYESGTYEPKSMNIIHDFAKLYEVPTDYLFGLDLDYKDYDSAEDMDFYQKYKILHKNEKEALKSILNIFINNKDDKNG